MESRDSDRAGAGPSGNWWQCQGHNYVRNRLWASHIPWAALAPGWRGRLVTPAPLRALCCGQGVFGNPQRRPPLRGSVGAATLALPPQLLSCLFISLRRSRLPPLPPLDCPRETRHCLHACSPEERVRPSPPSLGSGTVSGPVHGYHHYVTGALNATGQWRLALPRSTTIPAAAPPLPVTIFSIRLFFLALRAPACRASSCPVGLQLAGAPVHLPGRRCRCTHVPAPRSAGRPACAGACLCLGSASCPGVCARAVT